MREPGFLQGRECEGTWVPSGVPSVYKMEQLLHPEYSREEEEDEEE